MDTTVDALLKVAGRLLGPLQLVSDRSWSHGEAVVLEAVSAGDERVFVKAHRQLDKFETELRAYRFVLPRLKGRTPRLLAFEEQQRILVLSAVPGRVASASAADAAVHRRAGALLASLHAVGVGEWSGYFDWHQALNERLERWIARDAGWLAAAEVRAARAEVAAARALEPTAVPAHWDWQSRNWIVDGDALYALDFEHLRPDSWVADLQKLWWNEWRSRPDLRDAFLAGYGITLDDIDCRAFRALAAVHLVTTIVWGHGHDDPGYAAKAREGLALLMSTPGLPP